MGKVTDTYMPKKHWQFVIEAIDDEVKKQCEQLKKKKKSEMEEVLRRALYAAYQASLEMAIELATEDGKKTEQQRKLIAAALKELRKKLPEGVEKTLEKEEVERIPKKKDLKAWLKVWESVKQNPPPSKPLFDRWRLDFCLAVSRESGLKDQYALFLGQFEDAYTYSVKKWDSNKEATFQMKEDYQSVLKWTAFWMVLALAAYLMCFILHLTVEALPDIQFEIPSIPFAVILVVEGLILLIGLILAGVKSLEYDTKNPQETWARHEETVQKMNLEMLHYLLLKDGYRRPKPENSSEHPVVSTSIQVFPCPPKAEEEAQSAEMEFIEAIIQILEEDNAKFVRNMG